jgi:hypothetical protein
MKFFGTNNNSGGALAPQLADRRDYVISNIGAELPISTVTQVDGLFSGGVVTPQQYNVSLDTDWPHVWFGFYIGSIYSTTPSGGSVVQVKPQDLLIQIYDSNRDFLFSSPLSAAVIMSCVTSSNDASADNRNESFIINPMKVQPAGGSIRVEASNLNTSGNLGFEIVFMMWKQKQAQCAPEPVGRYSPMRNLTAIPAMAAGGR